MSTWPCTTRPWTIVHGDFRFGNLALDPVTFEVLKNSFITSVDQMGEQVLRTCYSFVIYNRDFSSALHDAPGECAARERAPCRRRSSPRS